MIKLFKWVSFALIGLVFVSAAVVVLIAALAGLGFLMDHYGFNVLMLAFAGAVIYVCQIVGQFVFFEIYSRATGKKFVFNDKWELVIKEETKPLQTQEEDGKVAPHNK